MAGLLSGLMKLKNVFSENFFIKVVGFDDSREYLLGHIIREGRKLEKQVVKLHFDVQFNHVPSRPTFSDLRNRSKMSFLNVGDIYFVQGATIKNGIYEFKWGNRSATDINKIYVGSGPAILHPLITNQSKQSLRVSIFKSESMVECQSINDVNNALEQIVNSAEKAETLRLASFMLQVVDGGECFSVRFSLGGDNANPQASLKRILSNQRFCRVTDVIQSDNLFGKAKVFVIPVGTHFFSEVKIAANQKLADFYVLDGKSMWRDSVYLFQKVKGSNNNVGKMFWAIQTCAPSYLSTDYMPNAYSGDIENKLWAKR